MKKGFTLIEVVIAAALLAISLSLFLGSFVSSKRSAVIASMRMEALNEARALMEDFMTKGYPDITPNPVVSNYVTVSGITNYYEYVVTPNAVYPNVRDIFLTLRWASPAASSTTGVTIATSISEAMD